MNESDGMFSKMDQQDFRPEIPNSKIHILKFFFNNWFYQQLVYRGQLSYF